MDTFETLTAARTAIIRFSRDHWDDVPEDLRDPLTTLMASPSPVDQVVGVGEFVWAHRGELRSEALLLGAGLIAFATTNAWHGLLDDGRGQAITANLRKAAGDLKQAPAAPEPLPRFAETPAPPMAV